MELEPWVRRMRGLLRLERESEEEEAKQGRKNAWACAIVDTEAALGGRTLVTLSGTAAPGRRLGAGDPVFVSTPPSKAKKGEDGAGASVEKGVVTAVAENRVSVSIEDLPSDWFDEPQLTMWAAPDDVTFGRMTATLDALERFANGDWGVAASSALVSTAFFGEAEPRFQPTTAQKGWNNSELDASQKEAVQHAMRCVDFALIHGPPGTGKTTTCVEIILQAVKCGQRVLVAAPSNVAVDNIVEKLSHSAVRMVRLGHPARLLPSVLDFCLDSLIAQSDGNKIVDDVRKCVLFSLLVVCCGVGRDLCVLLWIAETFGRCCRR